MKRVISLLALALACAGALAAPPAALAVSAPVSPLPAPLPTWQTDGGVYAIAVDPATGVTYIGGDFRSVRPPSGCTTCGGARARAGLAAFDRYGHLLSWQPRVDGPVYALAVSHRTRRVFAGGEFAHADGLPRRRLAAFREAGQGALRAWRPNPSAPVRALAVSGNRLFVAGTFRIISGHHRGHVAAYRLRLGSTPRLSRRFRADTNRAVLALAPARDGSGRIFLGGSFTRVNGHRRSHLAAVTVRGGRLARWRGRAAYRVIALAASRRMLYVGEGGPVGGALLAYVSRDGRRAWRIRADGDVQAVAMHGGAVYAGGHFQNVCGGDGSGHGTPWVCNQPIRRHKLFSVRGSRAAGRPSRAAVGLTRWNPSPNSAHGVFALRLWSGRLLAGGDFTRVGNQPQEGFIRFR